MDTTYIDIDSTFRNRQSFPNPANFMIENDFQNNRYDINNSENILCDSYPYYQWQWGCEGVGVDGLGNSVFLSTLTGRSLNGNVKEIILGDDSGGGPVDGNINLGGTSITTNYTTSDNYFKGILFKITETAKLQSTRISSYDSTDNLITVTGQLSGDEWNDTNDWSLTNPSDGTQIFVPGGSNKQGNYVGDYYEALMYGDALSTQPRVQQFRKIIAYDATTRLITLESAITGWDSTNGGANKSNDSGCTYLHRIRKALPILPISSTGLTNYTIPKMSSDGVAGSIYSVNIIESGNNFVIGDTITITSPGTDGSIRITDVDGNGSVLSINIIFCGIGITTNILNLTSATGTGLRVSLGLGTGINIHNTGTDKAIPNTTGEYKDKIFYCPSYISSSGQANTDPSSAQEFIPQLQSLDVDSKIPYTDDNHCSFKILNHSYDSGTNNIIVVKRVDDPTRFREDFEYNILDYSKDGINNFVNNNYLDVNKLHQKYIIELLSLTLPNKAIQTGPGGFIANQPFVFVEFFSEGSRNRQLYNTNNPNLESVLFKCIITDVSNPNTIPYVKLKCDYSVSINFDITKNMHFRVIMPNGQDFRTFTSDSVPPIEPKKELQVSATFSLTPINSDK